MASAHEMQQRNKEKILRYREWLLERTCNYKYGKPSQHQWNRLIRDSATVDFMFSKKIKLLICRNIYDICLITEDGEEYDWTRSSRHREDAETYNWNYQGRYKLAEVKLFLYRFSKMIDLSNVCFVKTAIGSPGFPYASAPNEYQFVGLTDIGKIFCGLKQVDIKEKITYIACSRFFTIIVTNYCKVYSFGTECIRQMDITTSTDEKNVPYEVIELTDNKIVKVVCEERIALILTDKGTVHVWTRLYGKFSNVGESVDIYTKFDKSFTRNVLDIATTGSMTIFAMKGGFFYLKDVYFSHRAGKNVLCEYTNMLDVSNAMASPSSIFMDRFIHSDEESNTLDFLETAFNDYNTSDLTIKIGEKFIYVHKALLRIRSSYFRSMFRCSWDENNQTVIEQSFDSYTVYEAFIKYLYTGVINLSLEDELVLLNLAHIYCEDNLQKYIICTIKKEITISNVLFIFERVVQRDATKELEEYCIKFFLRNMWDVTHTKYWKHNFDEEKKAILLKKTDDIVRSIQTMTAKQT